MTKRKHEDEEGAAATAAAATTQALLEEEKIKSTSTEGFSRREMQGQGDNRHTIDSDDEDDEREREAKFDRMKDDDIEGQEDGTLNCDGEIPITPFNLKEEQQEGSFSKDGDFVWNKKDDVKDAWLDDIDWVKVKQKTAEEVARQDQLDEDEDDAQAKYSELDTYREILGMMKPGESVAKTLRRLGGNKKPVAASERWKKKKNGGGAAAAADPEETRQKEAMLKLTGLADSILTRSGVMEIYEETYESISFRLKQEEEKKLGGKTDIPEGIDDEDALDMFADSLDDNKLTKNGGKKEEEVVKDSNGAECKEAEKEKEESILTSEVMWEFKWKNEEGEEVHGPHPSEKMLEWQESGFFEAGVWCRKVGTTGDFATSKRIDFDLYI